MTATMDKPVRYSVRLAGGRHYSFTGGFMQHEAILRRCAMRQQQVTTIYSESTSTGKPFLTRSYPAAIAKAKGEN